MVFTAWEGSLLKGRKGPGVGCPSALLFRKTP